MSTPDEICGAITALFARLEIREGEFTGTTLEELRAAVTEHYAEDVLFVDPLQSLRGREAFLEVNETLGKRAYNFGFDVTGSAWSDTGFYITWRFHFQPRRYAPSLRFEGVTHARVRDGQVVEHRDYWDLLGSVMDVVPVAGPLYRKLLALLA